jgi:hypothetical protein
VQKWGIETRQKAVSNCVSLGSSLPKGTKKKQLTKA